MVASIPMIWGLPPARTQETSCQVEGAPRCTYEFRWVKQPSRLWKFLGAGLGGTLAWFLAPHVEAPWPLWVSISAGGFVPEVYWDYFLKSLLEFVRGLGPQRSERRSF
ncbi:MAG: hypothetical protein R3C68_05555 [Myxococcota bacterium]